MRKSIVHKQDEFERWLVEETAVAARIVEKYERGNGGNDTFLEDMARWRLIFLLQVLGRYTDRDQAT